MADITITLTGTDELLQNLQKLDSGIRAEAAKRAVIAGAFQIGNKAKMNAPVLTSALRNSVETIARNTADGAEAEIGFRGLAYARIQEFGGTIYARNKPYLVFRYKGKWHKKKSVTITGKHYLQRAIDETQTLTVEAMSDVLKAYLNGHL